MQPQEFVRIFNLRPTPVVEVYRHAHAVEQIIGKTKENTNVRSKRIGKVRAMVKWLKAPSLLCFYGSMPEGICVLLCFPEDQGSPSRPSPSPPFARIKAACPCTTKKGKREREREVMIIVEMETRGRDENRGKKKSKARERKGCTTGAIQWRRGSEFQAKC